MEEYEHFKELEKAIGVAISCMVKERKTLEWQDNSEDEIKLLDESIRELQKFIERAK